MNQDDDVSPSGAPIYRHKKREGGHTAPAEDARNLEDIEAHLERYIGPVESVFHEVLSDLIHLDVLYIPPAADRPYAVLVTSGVSDLPMTVPEGMNAYARAELLIALPPTWPVSDEALKDESNSWPIRWLKLVGRLPHDYQTWIGWGHTIPNGDPLEPIDGTEFIGVMVSSPYWLSPDFFQLESKSGDLISFYVLVPLYAEEMELKLNVGAEELDRRLEEEDVGFVLDVRRRNVAKTKEHSE